MTAPYRAISLSYEVSQNIKHFIETGNCAIGISITNRAFAAAVELQL